MKHSLSIILGVLILFVSCEKKRPTIEDMIQECYFNSMPDNGKDLLRLFKEYETILIKKGVLKDSSARSYKKLYREILIKDFIDTKTNYSFIDSVNKLAYSDLIHRNNSKCSNKILKNKHYKESITYKIGKITDSLMESNGYSHDGIVSSANTLYSKIPERFFQYQYVKLRVLILIPDEDEAISQIQEPISESELQRAFVIYLDKNQKIKLNNKVLSKKVLVKKILNYLSKTVNPVIVINMSKDLNYGYYIKFQKFLQEKTQGFTYKIKENVIE